MASELYTMNPVGRKKRRKGKSKTVSRKRKRSVPKTRTVTRTVIRQAKRRRSGKRKAYATVLPARKRRGRKRRSFGLNGGGGKSVKKLSINSFIETLKTGAMNGAGAFASDIAMGFIRPMLPTALGFGTGRHFTRVAVGLLLGNLVSKLNPKFGNSIAVGTATVAGYEFAKETIQPMLPAGMVLGEYINDPQLGAYLPQDQLGYAGSGQDVGMGGVGESSYYNAYA